MTTTRQIAWGAKVSPAFKEKLIAGCEDTFWYEDSANDLMGCMAFETGRTFSPRVKSPVSSAIGLIQFMSATATNLGTSTSQLASMTAEQQLYFVFKYFRPYRGKIRNIEDMYMVILWPKAVGKAIDYVLWRTGTRAYVVNKALDWNKDGRVTKSEATRRVVELRSEGLKPGNLG